MGNIAEAGGFGDTRLPSEEAEEDYAVLDPIDPNAYTYRNGVNYKKVSENPLMMEYSSNIPRSIQTKYLQNESTNFIELERIWEAYKSLLVDQALEELSKPDSGSNILRMISIRKLYKEGKMYMSQEEIQAIQSGQLRQYLLQFNKLEDEESEALDLDFANLRSPSPNTNKAKLISVGLNPGINLNNQRGQQKRKYQPQGNMKVQNDENQEPSTFQIDMEMRRSDCQFLNQYNVEQKSSRGLTFGIVQLDFDDFFYLMQLKIQYQRQSISQDQFAGKPSRGMGSVEYAAAQAYGQRLSADPLDSKREMMKNKSQQRFGISKTPSQQTLKEQGSNVVVETTAENVSCFLWPFFEGQVPPLGSMQETQQSQNNITVSQHVKNFQQSQQKLVQQQQDIYNMNNQAFQDSHLPLDQINELNSMYEYENSVNHSMNNNFAELKKGPGLPPQVKNSGLIKTPVVSDGMSSDKQSVERLDASQPSRQSMARGGQNEIDLSYAPRYQVEDHKSMASDIVSKRFINVQSVENLSANLSPAHVSGFGNQIKKNNSGYLNVQNLHGAFAENQSKSISQYENDIEVEEGENEFQDLNVEIAKNVE